MTGSQKAGNVSIRMLCDVREIRDGKLNSMKKGKTFTVSSAEATRLIKRNVAEKK